MSVQIQSNGKNKGICQGIIVQRKLLTESGELKSPLLQGMIRFLGKNAWAGVCSLSLRSLNCE